MFGSLSLPGLDQVPPGRELAAVITVARRVVAADLELAGGLHQAVGDPALEHGVIVIAQARGAR